MIPIYLGNLHLGKFFRSSFILFHFSLSLEDNLSSQKVSYSKAPVEITFLVVLQDKINLVGHTLMLSVLTLVAWIHLMQVLKISDSGKVYLL